MSEVEILNTCLLAVGLFNLFDMSLLDMIWYELGIVHFSVIYPVKTEEEYCVSTGGAMEAVAQEAGNKADKKDVPRAGG